MKYSALVSLGSTISFISFTIFTIGFYYFMVEKRRILERKTVRILIVMESALFIKVLNWVFLTYFYLWNRSDLPTVSWETVYYSNTIATFKWFFVVEQIGYFGLSLFLVFYEHGLVTYFFVATCSDPRECSKRIKHSKIRFTYTNILMLSLSFIIAECLLVS